jgi:hypothetical protein
MYPRGTEPAEAQRAAYTNVHKHRTVYSPHGVPMGTDKRRRAVDSTIQPKTKDDSVRMTAKALIMTTTEPSRAHAVDLVLLGHLLASRLKRDCSVHSESDFARVWRDHVVPVAAASRSDWQVGMCAEITADLTTTTGVSFKNVVGRVSGTARTGAPIC